MEGVRGEIGRLTMATREVTTTYTLRVVWEDDWDVGDHQKEYDCYEDSGPETCERAAVFGPNGECLAALGCIDDADEDYRQEIERELLDEAESALNA